MIILKACKKRETEGLFVISFYICIISHHSLACLHPMWALWDYCLPAHHSSSQGRVPPWEYTKDFSVIKEPVLSLLRSDVYWRSGTPGEISSLTCRSQSFFAFEITVPHQTLGWGYFWIDFTVLPTKPCFSFPVQSVYKTRSEWSSYIFPALVTELGIRQTHISQLFFINWTCFCVLKGRTRDKECWKMRMRSSCVGHPLMWIYMLQGLSLKRALWSAASRFFFIETDCNEHHSNQTTRKTKAVNMSYDTLVKTQDAIDFLTVIDSSAYLV